MSTRKKFELSPRLKLGVGRGYSQNKALKIGAVACLCLAGALALYGARLIFTNSGALDKAAPQVLGASDFQGQQTEPQVEFLEYKVKSGDTLFNVSQKFNINWTTLSTLNNIKSPFTLKPGQILKIPK